MAFTLALHTIMLIPWSTCFRTYSNNQVNSFRSPTKSHFAKQNSITSVRATSFSEAETILLEDKDYHLEQLIISSVSINPDLSGAIDEVLFDLSTSSLKANKFDAALFFISSIYDAASLSDILLAKLKHSNFRGVNRIFGSTAGGILGPQNRNPNFEPSEVEGRACFGLTLLQSKDIICQNKYLSNNEIEDYINSDTRELFNPSKHKTGIILCSESAKPLLSKFASSIGSRENVSSYGVVASVVTSLHQPKIFATSDGDGDTESDQDPILQKHTEGLVVLTIDGTLST